MTLEEFEDVLKENKMQYDGELSLDMKISDLGFDSFDLTMLAFELEKDMGRELKITATDTIADVLRSVENG
jgi:acyl carrier protein